MKRAFTYERLTPDHIVLPFDCGVKDLNEFLINDAKDYLEQLIAVTYYVESETDTVLYFSLSNDKISSLEVSKAFWRKLKKAFPHSKHRKDYPAVKIGRFGVNLSYQKSEMHWGSETLRNIKLRMRTISHTGCRFLTVDAYYNAVPFYKHNGFLFMGKEEEDRYNNTSDEEEIFAMYYDLSWHVLA